MATDMQAHSFNLCTLLGLIAWLSCANWTMGAEPVTLEATLILASNDPAPIDARLERVEYKLRRIFGFEHYAHQGEGRSLLSLPGDTTIELGEGYRLEVSATGGRKKGVRAHIRWMKDGKKLLSTKARLKAGVPTILGGPAHKGGNLIVVLVAK